MKAPKRPLPRSTSGHKVTVARHPVGKPVKKTDFFDRRILIIAGIVVVSLIFLLAGFLTIKAVTNKDKAATIAGSESSSPAAEQTQSAEIADQQDFSVAFGEPQINGTSEAILHAELLSEKEADAAFGFEVRDSAGTVIFDGSADYLDGGIYAKAVGLQPDTAYTLYAFRIKDDNKQIQETPYTFKTPARTLSLDEVETLVENTCQKSTETMAEDTKTLFHAHAIMELLGMDFDLYERMETLTQVNQVMLDYSLNSYNNYVFWNNINEAPTKESVALLKDILSVNPKITKDDIIKDFVISPYSMTAYAYYDNYGGQVSSEDYIFDLMKDDQNASVYYATEYPYIVDTPEFQEKYADLINGVLDENSDEMKALIRIYGSETFDQPQDVMLAAIAAKNKAQFADICAWWLEQTAVLPEKRLYLYSESGRYSMDSMLAPTMTAFAYMYDEFREQTGLELTVNNCYRSCETQWDKYAKGYGKAQALAWSGLWHLDRQVVSYVPGYSNHQFAISIDFEPAQYVFNETEMYDYLVKNAAKYGMYNYALETWHWTYLGMTIPQETIDSIKLEEPLVDQ